MRSFILFCLIFLWLLPAFSLYCEDVIVYTATQSWNSRIYILHMDGSVYNYYEYEYYIFSDMEVVDNEVYVTDWVAPRLYRFNPYTGGIEVIVDDWNLFSMYDVAFDGTYFYIDEWNLNRYDINGDWDSTADFDEAVRGGAWDDEYYWTLNTDGEIRCWDISDWETIVEVPSNNFSPPTSDCKGLWFDGEYFWTAESLEDSPGYIYKFDYAGNVLEQWQEPTFSGYSAVVVEDFDTGIQEKSLGEIKALFE